LVQESTPYWYLNNDSCTIADGGDICTKEGVSHVSRHNLTLAEKCHAKSWIG
jgi:hypothetical protein